MKKSYLFGFTFVLNSLFYTSHTQAETLFTINGQPTSVEEFSYIYQKNNINGQADFSKQSLEDYLKLFINYKLKVQEAKDLGLDTIPALKAEYEGYRKQLLDAHLKKVIDEPLMKQEYERAKLDVAISHIFVDKKSEKSLERIQEAMSKLKKGQDFATVAQKYSADSLSAKAGGKIGYFTALQIGFPQIEDAIYNTPVGKYSDIIETDLGYHILKVDDVRPARGRIKVAMIKIAIPEAESEKITAQNKVDSLYQLLMKGEEFAPLAVKYSDDPNSSMKGGELDWFGINTYVKEFEDAAFALKNNGEISKPFATSNSWYIIKKLSEVKTQTYQESEPVLQAKIKRSRFYQHTLENFLEKIKAESGYKEYVDNIEKFEGNLEPLLEVSPFVYQTREASYPLFSIGGKEISQRDILPVIEKNISAVANKKGHDKTHALIDIAIQEYAMKAYEQKLKDSLTDYKSLLEEYENGVLIFELTKDKVWNKANSDSVGLQNFYDKMGNQYMWNYRAEIVKFEELGTYQEKSLNKLINKKKLNSLEAWSQYVAENPQENIKIQTFLIEKGVTEGADQIRWEVGLHTAADGKLYYVTQLILPQRKDLKDVRGFVVAAYQEHLEKEWLNSLHQIYKVQIETKVLEKLVK